MRIAYFSRFARESRGAGVHARALVKAWEAAGHDVLCVPPCQDTGSGAQNPSRGNPVLADGYLRWILSSARAVGRGLREYPKIKRALRAFQPDVLVARRSMYDWTLALLTRASSLDLVAEVNAVSYLERESLNGLRTAWWETRSERAYLRRARRCVCVSEEVADHVKNEGVSISRISVVPNGVDTTLFTPRARAAEQVRRWRAGRARLVAFAGTGVSSHDLGTMVRAAARICAACSSVGFVFVGLDETQVAQAGATRRVLEHSLALGPVDHELVPGYLAPADVLWAALTHSHGSPLKLYEYLAMGKPVVAACAGQAARLLTDLSSGRAVERSDDAALAEAVISLLSLDPADLARLGRTSRDWVVENADWSSVAERMIAHLNNE